DGRQVRAARQSVGRVGIVCFFQAEDGIRERNVTGVQTCALPISFGLKRLDELIDGFELDDRDVFVMVDEDKNGESLRALLKSELPHAEDIFIQREFKEVEKTPHYILAHLLWAKHIEIDPMYLR